MKSVRPEYKQGRYVIYESGVSKSRREFTLDESLRRDW